MGKHAAPTLSQYSKQYRQEHGLNMIELGKKLGVSSQTVHRVEQGESVSIETLQQMCHGFGITLRQGLTLLGFKLDDEDRETEQLLRQISAYPESRELLEILRDIDRPTLERLVEYAQFVRARR